MLQVFHLSQVGSFTCYKLGLSPVISCLSHVTSWVFHMLQVGSFTCHKLSFMCYKLGLSRTSWVFHMLQVGSFTCHKLSFTCTSWVFHCESCLSQLGLSQVPSCLSHATSWVFHLSQVVFHVLQVGSFTCHKLSFT